MANQDPSHTFKNDQIKEFRRIDPGAIQYNGLTLTVAREFLDMVDIDGGTPDGTKVTAGLIEDTAGELNGKVNPGLILRAIVPMLSGAAIDRGEAVYATGDNTVTKCPNDESKAEFCCGRAMGTASGAAEVILVYFNAMAGSINA